MHELSVEELDQVRRVLPWRNDVGPVGRVPAALGPLEGSPEGRIPRCRPSTDDEAVFLDDPVEELIDDLVIAYRALWECS